MNDFDPHITIDERTDAKDIKCAAKIITIDTHRMEIETPVKVLSGKSITDKTANELLPSGSTPIFELTKTYYDLTQYARLIHTLQYGGENKDWIEVLNDSLILRRGLESTFRKNITVSSVFQYYPINDLNLRNHHHYERMGWDLYQTYLDYIYNVSSAFILTPDVILSAPRTRQISIHEYIRFIDNSVESFERQNNKPIFVPLQIDLADMDLRDILVHYKEYGYTNIWINFKAKKCDGSNAGRLRVLSRLIEDDYLGKDAVIYCSQIKRQRDVTQNSIPAFDMLPPFLSADFVGVNRTSPVRGGELNLAAQRKGFESSKEYQNAVKQSNCSIFNPETYMYCLPAAGDHTEETFLAKAAKNITTADFFNGIRIDQELSIIKSQIHDDKDILPYLQTKEGVKNNMEIFGKAAKDKSTPGRPTDLTDFF